MCSIVEAEWEAAAALSCPENAGAKYATAGWTSEFEIATGASAQVLRI